MATKVLLLLFLLLLLGINLVAPSQGAATGDDTPGDDQGDDDAGLGASGSDYHPFNRTMFPPDFIFGAATSAYQIEGATNEYGRGPSIWDTFIVDHPDAIKDGGNASIAADSYNRYKEDVAKIKDLGLDAYRFSISWSRILPTGRRSGGINWKGAYYYYKLIEELDLNGIKPYVTIFHWDLPQALEDEYNGFLNEKIVDDFRDYADLLFKLYGKRIRHWITVNEPRSYTVMGYAAGVFPPERCSSGTDFGLVGYSLGGFSTKGVGCNKGESSIEPYVVAHNLILAHAAAVQVYRENYQESQKGEIGLTLDVDWMIPYDPKSTRDIDAARRALAFNYGWFMDPINIGQYPTEMVTRVGDRLPTFTPDQVKMVKGSYDFIGINYHTSTYAKDIDCSSTDDYFTDPCVQTTSTKNGVPIGKQAGSVHIFPWGLRQILLYTKDKYNNPNVYIAGVDKVDQDTIQHDYMRKFYHKRCITYVHNTVKKNACNVKGYFIWSLMDKFEWLDGYTAHVGIIFIDYENQSLDRTYKDSANWFKGFLLKD